MILTEPIHINFTCPAIDALGREHLIGKLRFLPEYVELSWRMLGNVFTGGKSELSVIDLPYGEIEHVELVKKWWKIRQLVFRVSDPRLTKDIPTSEMGKLVMEIDDRSRQEAQKLSTLIDFKRSVFLLDAQEKRLQAMRDED